MQQSLLKMSWYRSKTAAISRLDRKAGWQAQSGVMGA